MEVFEKYHEPITGVVTNKSITFTEFRRLRMYCQGKKCSTYTLHQKRYDNFHNPSNSDRVQCNLGPLLLVIIRSTFFLINRTGNIHCGKLKKLFVLKRQVLFPFFIWCLLILKIQFTSSWYCLNYEILPGETTLLERNSWLDLTLWFIALGRFHRKVARCIWQVASDTI